MFLTDFASHLYDDLLTLLYPQPCSVCGRSIEKRAFIPACEDCWRTARIFTGDELVCWKCGAVARQTNCPVNREEVRCGRCDHHSFDVARACGIYEGALRESLLLLKRQPFLSIHVVRLLVLAAKRTPLNTATRIIPVPLHAEREQQRGFNQASVMARAIAPYLRLVVDDKSLTRITSARKYRAGLDARGRADTVAEAFAVRLPQVIEGELILLVDDVLTTGATASSCAQALLTAGARTVYVLTAARPAA